MLTRRKVDLIATIATTRSFDPMPLTEADIEQIALDWFAECGCLVSGSAYCRQWEVHLSVRPMLKAALHKKGLQRHATGNLL